MHDAPIIGSGPNGPGTACFPARAGLTVRLAESSGAHRASCNISNMGVRRAVLKHAEAMELPQSFLKRTNSFQSKPTFGPRRLNRPVFGHANWHSLIHHLWHCGVFAHPGVTPDPRVKPANMARALTPASHEKMPDAPGLTGKRSVRRMLLLPPPAPDAAVRGAGAVAAFSRVPSGRRHFRHVRKEYRPVLAGPLCGSNPSTGRVRVWTGAGLGMTGSDFVPTDTCPCEDRLRRPWATGAGRMNVRNNGPFTGNAVLAAWRTKGIGRGFVGARIGGNIPAESAILYHIRKTGAGVITGAIGSPGRKRNSAMAQVLACFAQGGTIWAEICVLRALHHEKLSMPARVVERPFFNHPRRRATPSGRF